MFYLENNREQLYQWDSNQRLIIDDETITAMHYSNKTSTEALVVEVYEESGKRYADIPNILLQDIWNIYAYAYCGNCYTKQSKFYKIVPRSKPADYIYTETEIKRWETLEAEIKAEMAATEAQIAARVDNALIQYANVLKGKKSGTEGLLNDVSPIPHTLEITTEPNANVTLCGKNLLDLTQIKGKTVTLNGGTLHCDENGYITGSGTPTGGCAFSSFRLNNFPKAQMVLSTHGVSTNLAAVIYLKDKDGKTLVYFGVDSERDKITVKANQYEFEYATIEIKRSGSGYEMSGGFYLQLELGIKTDYEPALPPTIYTANENGVIEGVQSIYPSLTFVADKETTIKYNRDTNAVINQLTQAIISLGGNV